MSDNVKDLATAVWRLEKWIDSLVVERKMAGVSALRSIKKYLESQEVTIVDPVGNKFDPGLAIEVVNNESDSEDEENLIIIETLTPNIYQEGKLIQHARVIIGDAVKETKPVIEVVKEETKTVNKPVKKDSTQKKTTKSTAKKPASKKAQSSKSAKKTTTKSKSNDKNKTK